MGNVYETNMCLFLASCIHIQIQIEIFIVSTHK